MGQAQLAFGIDRPSTLDEALNVIERISGSLATLTLQAQSFRRPQTTCSDCGDLINDDDDMALSYEIDRLVEVRQAIKAGRPDDALYQLEKILSELDSGWMCRA